MAWTSLIEDAANYLRDSTTTYTLFLVISPVPASRPLAAVLFYNATGGSPGPHSSTVSGTTSGALSTAVHSVDPREEGLALVAVLVGVRAIHLPLHNGTRRRCHR